MYDLAALALIHKRLTAKQTMDEFGQIIVDEGQDFGEMVYYVLKQVLAAAISQSWGMCPRTLTMRPE